MLCYCQFALGEAWMKFWSKYKASDEFTKMHLIISSAKWRPFCPREMSWNIHRVYQSLAERATVFVSDFGDFYWQGRACKQSSSGEISSLLFYLRNSNKHYDDRALNDNPGLQYPPFMVQCTHLITTGGTPHLYNRGSSMQVNSLHSGANNI